MKRETKSQSDGQVKMFVLRIFVVTGADVNVVPGDAWRLHCVRGMPIASHWYISTCVSMGEEGRRNLQCPELSVLTFSCQNFWSFLQTTLSETLLCVFSNFIWSNKTFNSAKLTWIWGFFWSCWNVGSFCAVRNNWFSGVLQLNVYEFNTLNDGKINTED